MSSHDTGVKVRNILFLFSSVTSCLCDLTCSLHLCLVPSLIEGKLYHVTATWGSGALSKEDAAYVTQAYLVWVQGVPGMLVLQLSSTVGKMVVDLEGFSPCMPVSSGTENKPRWLLSPQHSNPLWFSQPFGLEDRNDLRAPDIISSPPIYRNLLEIWIYQLWGGNTQSTMSD